MTLSAGKGRMKQEPGSVTCKGTDGLKTFPVCVCTGALCVVQGSSSLF